MKAYKVELLIIDHDELGADGIKDVIENVKYPNYCIAPDVKNIECVDIGEWDDDHPLNKFSTCDEEYKRLFENESVADYIDRHIVESMVETGKEFVKNNWYSEEEVSRLLETQRGNCYVAVLSKCRDEEIATACVKAPEPGGDQWKKTKKS